jgi:hypothetical protein
MRAMSRWLFLLGICLASGSGVLHAATLNMSHDLTTLGIASQNLTPNQPALDARPLMQAAIQYLQSHPVQLLTLDKGNYYLLTNELSSAVLVFPNLSNMTIDLAGSTFYFVGPQLPNGLELYYCTGVTLTNFTVDYLHPPYTHVKLASVDAVNRLLKYQLLPGWPDPATFNSLTDPFSGGPIEGYIAAIFRNGSLVPGTTRTELKAPFSNNTLPIQDPGPWAQSATLATLKAGDTVVVTTRGGGPPILVWESSEITLSKITIQGSPTWAVELSQTNNSTVEHVSIIPRPGTGLIGSDADGIHFIPAGTNNHILNCTVRATMDDALIMESNFAGMFVSQAGPRRLTVTRQGYFRFANGTAMNFVNPATTLAQTGGVILSQDPPDSPYPSYNGAVTLTFDRNLPALAQGAIMVFASEWTGRGSTIEDNLVEDTYGGRGVWLSGVNDVAVERNVLRNTSMTAVGMIQETDESGDPGDVGGPVQNITVTDNAIEGSQGPAACGTGEGACLAAIETQSVDDRNFGFAPSGGNPGIVIERNYIADSGRSGVWIGETDGATFEDNLIIRSNRNPTLGGTFGIPPPFAAMVTADALVPVAIHYSSDIQRAANTIEVDSDIEAPVTAPSKVTVAASAAAHTFALKTQIGRFAWRAASDSAWLTTTASGEGNGSVGFSVSANTSVTTRTGHITVAGVVVTITQRGK